MSKRTPILELIEQEDLSSDKKMQLSTILQLRRFASEHLHLPDNKSYTSYVELDREFVVWNVVATPEFSLTPISSCFVFVGCLQYKGFYNKQGALGFANKLRKSGHDVFIGGVAAYSTLGWFDDPVLSSMLRYGEARLAEVMFHELAHQLIYVKDDSAFNEAFATQVGEMGVQRWFLFHQNGLGSKGNVLEKFKRQQHADADFIQLILRSKESLEILYASDLGPKKMRIKKRALFAKLRIDYQQLKNSSDLLNSYDQWMAQDLNNAKIASVVTYHELTAAFANLLDLSDQDLDLFYRRVHQLSSLTKENRDQCLEKIKSNQINECWREK